MAGLTKVAPKQNAPKNDNGGSDKAPAYTMRMIDHVEVEVEVMLGGARMTIAELNTLAADTVIPLDRRINEAADISINGRVIARGEIVTVDDCFAIRVTQIPGR